MLKKSFVVLVAVSFAFGLAACKPRTESTTTTTTDSTTTPSTTESTTTAPQQ